MENLNYRTKWKDKTAVIIAIITWVIVAMTLIWHCIVLGWVILQFFFPSNLYIPATVKMTSYTMISVMLWIFIVYLLGVIWVKYNRFRFKKKHGSVHTTNQSIFIGQELPWSEVVISNINSLSILEEVESIKNNMSIVKLRSPVPISTMNIRNPEKQLNKAIALIRNGDISKGISTLRTILEQPEASPMIKKIANIKLGQCLYELGYKDLADIKNTEAI